MIKIILLNKLHEDVYVTFEERIQLLFMFLQSQFSYSFL